LKYDKNKIELMKIAKYKDKKNIIIILENILGACLSVYNNKIRVQIENITLIK